MILSVSFKNPVLYTFLIAFDFTSLFIKTAIFIIIRIISYYIILYSYKFKLFQNIALYQQNFSKNIILIFGKLMYLTLIFVHLLRLDTLKIPQLQQKLGLRDCY